MSEFTVQLAEGINPGSVVITPLMTGVSGTFVPATITLTDSERSGTFQFVPRTAGLGILTIENNGVLRDPEGQSVQMIPSGFSVSGPSQGVVGEVSGEFTVSLSDSLNPGSLRVALLMHGLEGEFEPDCVTLTDVDRSGVFTFRPSAVGKGVLMTANNRSLPNPDNIAFVAVG